MIKICLISFGILLGLYFFNYLAGLTVLWWVLFVVIALYFIARLFKKEDTGQLTQN